MLTQSEESEKLRILHPERYLQTISQVTTAIENVGKSYEALFRLEVETYIHRAQILLFGLFAVSLLGALSLIFVSGFVLDISLSDRVRESYIWFISAAALCWIAIGLLIHRFKRRLAFPSRDEVINEPSR